MLAHVKKDSARMVSGYEHLKEERGGASLAYPYHVPRRVVPVRTEKRSAGVVMGGQLEFFLGEATHASTCGTNTVSEWAIYPNSLLGLGVVFIECGAPSGVASFAQVTDGITMLNNAIAEDPISQAHTAEEEDVVEFRLLSPRVESIASLRDKVKLNKAAMDFVKGVRAHALRIDDVEDQSE